MRRGQPQSTMKFELSICIAGEAGQGTQTIGKCMCRIFKRAGLQLFAIQDYMSRVRGGNNFYQIRVSTDPVFCPREKNDILVALDAASIALHTTRVHENGIIVVDAKKGLMKDADARVLDVPMGAMVAELGVGDILINSVAFGALAGLTGIPFNIVTEVLSEYFLKKGDAIIAANTRAASTGNEFTHARFPQSRFALPVLPDLGRLLINGNDALTLGAIRAGCKFYSAYPMSPSTTIMETMSGFAPDYGIVVEQAEDEIAAVNMVIGASFAGVRTMTSTSGGGFALMGEGISLAGMTETPLVIVNGQRPAPATGFPTRTEQADLDLAIHSGHGEFARAVFAPGTPEESFAVMLQAFEIAEKYQIPVVVLSDQYLADSLCSVNPAFLSGGVTGRFILSRKESNRMENYQRYAMTESGISPRAVPSWIKTPFYVDSDEHTPDGHITEDAAIRKTMVEKRFYKKLAGLQREVRNPVAVNTADAQLVLVGFGSTYGVMREAAESIRNRKIGFVHLSQVWPFPTVELRKALKNAQQIVTVENNAGAQLARLMRRETGIVAHQSLLKYDGRPFDLDYLIRELNGG
jgi:2-oxoglutarate/2-oxoacid ferredoxin oxidoreductase subunit alpha